MGFLSSNAPQPMSLSAVEAQVEAGEGKVEATIGARGLSGTSRISLEGFLEEEITMVADVVVARGVAKDVLQEARVAGLFPSSPVLLSTSRSATAFPSRAAGRCPSRAAGLFQGRSQDSSALTSQDSSAGPCPSRAAGLSPSRAVGLCQSRAAGQFPSRVVVLYPSRAVALFPNSSAGMFPVNSASRFPRR